MTATLTDHHTLNSFNLRLKNNQIKRFNKPCVMGIINASPNSFFKPIKKITKVLYAVEEMVAAGAAIIDVGGEATNPAVDLNKHSPDVSEEIARVVPVLEAIRQRFDILLSVDTSQPAVMRAAIDAGADMVNDQRALRMPDAMNVVSELQVPVCLMHFFHPPRQPDSCDASTLLAIILKDLQQFVQACEAKGIQRDRIVIDPGFGQGNYGKSGDENFYLLAHLRQFSKLDLPILVGWSRKSMIGDVLGGAPATDRLYGSIASATLAAYLGASIIRVHDVKATVDALKVVAALQQHVEG